MPDTTGKIRAKALDQTGITEAMLESDWAKGAGWTRMAIVELRTVEPHGPNLDGKRRIDYVVEAIEPVPEAQEDVVREFQRAIYRTRPEVEGQAVLSGTAGEGPTLDQAATQLDAQIERDENGIVKGVWDGDMDAPLEDPAAPETPEPEAKAGDEVAAKRKGRGAKAETVVMCDYPTCDLPYHEDGDHHDPAAD